VPVGIYEHQPWTAARRQGFERARIERFWERVDRSAGPQQCWPWTGSRNWLGYGRAKVRGRHSNAHRIAYLLAGRPIPAGFQVDHLCRVRACCNPQHLEAVPARENVLRGEAPSAQNASKTHCSRGHSFEGSNLVVTKSKNQRYRECRTCQRERVRRYRARRREADS
jgi:hypothetical protein